MRIGIFGDSFANHYRNDSLSWVQILEKKYKITNYAEPASSLYFSISKFFEHSATEKFDHIIFCITGPGRLYLPEHSAYTVYRNQDPTDRFTTRHAYPQAGDFLPEEIANTKSQKIVDAIKSYYLYIENTAEQTYYHHCAVQDLKRLRPEALFLQRELWDVCAAEDEYYFKNKNRNDYHDLKNCHLTANNNQITAELIDKWICGQTVSFSLDQFDLPPSEPFEKYFIPVQDQR